MPAFPKYRVSILSIMISIALVGGILGLVAAYKRVERQKRIALVTSDLKRQADRLKWAEDMHRKGYLSKATLISDQMRRDEIEKELKELGVPRP